MKHFRQKPVSRDPVVMQKLNEGFGRNTFTRNMKLVRDYYDTDKRSIRDVKDLTKS